MLLKQNYFLGLLILGSIAAAQPAFATVNFGISNGYGLGSSLPPMLPQAHTPYVLGIAPAPYDTSELGVPILNYTSGSPGSFDLTVLSNQGQVRSDVDGLPGVRTTTGLGEVNGVSIILGSDASGTLSLTGTTFGSEALVTGEYGSLTQSGVSNIVGLSLIFDTALVGDSNDVFNLMGTANVAPNTNLISFLAGNGGILGGLSTFGVSITLNEQSGLCNGIDFCEINVRALRIDGHNLQFVEFGQSYAKQTAIPVPEASTYGMMLAGLGLVGAMVARRHKPIPAVALT